MLDAHTETLLNLYVDGELPLDRQGELHARLADDREARAQFNALMAFRLATRVDANMVAPAVDEALFARIDELRASHAPTQRAEDRRPFRALRRRVTVGTALALAVFVLVVRALLPTPVDLADAAEAVPAATASTVYVVWPGVTVEEDTLEGVPDTAP